MVIFSGALDGCFFSYCSCLFGVGYFGFNELKYSVMKVKLLFAWFDLWIGFYWDKSKRNLYFLPLPMFGIVIHIPKKIKHDRIRNN